jgi:KaiC/GvpD/RAD55 family RecA-like ATPase
MMQIDIPQNSASIVISPPLSGKKEFLFNCIADALEKKEPVIFISTDFSSEDIKKELAEKKLYDESCKGRIRFIDCYSQEAGKCLDDTEDTKRISGPLALNEVSVALAQTEEEISAEPKKHLVIFDSLSTILMFLNSLMIGRFLQVFIAKIKNAGGSVVFTLEDGMHEQKDTVTIEHMMQLIVHMKREGSKIMIRADGIEEYEEWKDLEM